ncbi:MAG: hypothetical protein RRY12_13330, partial [Cloacibacillus sp.]
WRWIKTLSSQWNCYWLLASGSLSRFWMIPQIASVVTEPVAAEIVGDDLRDRILAYEHRRIAYLYDPQPKSGGCDSKPKEKPSRELAKARQAARFLVKWMYEKQLYRG